MRCPSCDAENPGATKFCGNCGQALRDRCAKCGSENPPQFKFCGECGTTLHANTASSQRAAASRANSSTPAERPSLNTHEVIDGERKTVTALFADIKGSTELMEDLDPEEARAIIDPALKLMIDAAHRYDGYVVQSTGDGIFALFGAPVAHEEHPQRAVYAALHMQEELRRYSTKVSCGWRNARRSARRREHRRSGSAIDHDGRGSGRIHADRAHDESRLADAGSGADWIHRGE